MKITERAIDQPLVSILLGGLLFCFGFISYLLIPTEAVPEIKTPVASVIIPYIGAGPAEIETEILKPLEDRLQDIEDVDFIHTIASEGFGFALVRYLEKADMVEQMRNLREKVSDAEQEFPEDAENAEVEQMDFNDIPILILNIFGELPLAEISITAENLKDKIENIPGINLVEIFGDLKREISITVDPDLLQMHGIPISSIAQILSSNNVNIPGGNVTIQGENLLVRSLGRFKSVDDLSRTVLVQYPDGSSVRLSDVAVVIDSIEKPDTYSRYNQKSSITLLIRKNIGYNIISTSNAVETLVEEFSNQFPIGLKYEFSARQVEEIEQSTNQLKQNAGWGIFFVITTLFFGLGFRNSLIVTFAIPFSIFTAYLLQYAFEISQSGITIFALIMVLGIVVDGAIVVSEAAFSFMEKGHDRKLASKLAIQQVGMPIITAVLTTIAAFAPMMYMTGIMGQFLSYIPKIIIFSLIGATVADHIIIPVLASQLMSLRQASTAMTGNWVGKQWYTKIITLALKHRLRTLSLAFLSFIFGILVLGISAGTDLNLIKVQAFPKVPKPRIVVDIMSPPGTDLEQTNRTAMELEQLIGNLHEVERFATTVGESGVQNVRLNQSTYIGSEIAQINIDLTDKDERDRSVEDIIEFLQNETANMPGIDITFDVIEEGPPIEDGIVLDIVGDDMDKIRELSEQIKQIMEQTTGTRNVTSSLGIKRKEIQIDVDHDKAAILGVSAAQIAHTVSSALYGFEVTTLQDGLDEVPVVLKMEHSEDTFLNDLRSLEVGTQFQSLEPISNMADIDYGLGQFYVFRKNFKRTVSVSADIKQGFNQGKIKRQLDPFLDKLHIPNGIHIEYGGITDETTDSFRSLAKSMGIAFVIILVLLSGQFKSLRQPFIIAMTIPLSFIGVIIGLMITRQAFGLMAFFGIVALTGIVVNDAIVFISHINDLRKDGASIHRALVIGGQNRLRPILLTSITTIVGLIPLTFDFAGGAEYWRPLAVSIIFGLLAATLLTLVIVPVLYSYFERMPRDAWKNI